MSDLPGQFARADFQQRVLNGRYGRRFLDVNENQERTKYIINQVYDYTEDVGQNHSFC